MPKYKLLRLYTLLEPDERLELEKFIQHKSRSGNNECLQLCLTLKRLPSESLDAEKIKPELFKGIYGKKAPYEDGKLRKVMNRLISDIEHFLIQRELANQPGHRERLLIDALRRRKDYELFKEVVEKRLSAMEMAPAKGRQYFKEKQELLEMLYFHPSTAKLNANNDYLQQAVQVQEWNFSMGFLLLGAEWFVKQRITRIREEVTYFDAAFDYMEHKQSESPPVVALFKKILKILLPGEVRVDLSEFVAMLKTHFPSLDELEQGMALKLLVTYALPHAGRGCHEHNLLIFNLYRLGIEHGLIPPKNTDMDAATFLNVAYSAVTAGEMEWAAVFISDFLYTVNEEDREYTRHVCLGRWHYQMGIDRGEVTHFQEALQHLNYIPIRSKEIFDLRARQLQLQIAFELMLRGGMILDDVLAQAKNFKAYISAHSIFSETYRVSFLNFIDCYKKLVRLALYPNTTFGDVSELLSEIESKSPVTLSYWLKQKAESMQKQ